MSYRVTKTYGHELGLSACFRQWRATSHCRFLHGYALAFKFVFESDTLDHNNWVINFGGLKPLKQWLMVTFDHKLVVAEDDPARDVLQGIGGSFYWDDPDSSFEAIADVLVVPATGCEQFARMAWEQAQALLNEWQGRAVGPLQPGVRLVEVECREHAGNAASYMGSN